MTNWLEGDVLIIDQSLIDFLERSGEILERITDCLSKYLKIDVHNKYGFVPAALIFNPIASDCAVWIDQGKAYGKARSIDAIKQLLEISGWLKNCDIADLSDSQIEQIIERLCTHSGPLFYLISDGVNPFGRSSILDAVDFLTDHLTNCLKAEEGCGGNYRAFRSAVALRAIFETYGNQKVTAGDSAEGHPSGVFSGCLAEIFSILLLNVGFRHYAERARDLPPDDPLLKHLRQELIDVPARISASGH